jgi:hypothetical protein
MARRRLPKKKVILILTGLVLVLVMSGWLWADEFSWYCHPSGTINYRGTLAPEGLSVSAIIDGTKFASGLTTAKGTYDLTIPQDDPNTAKKEGWAEGDTITIMVGDFAAVPRFAAFSGQKTIDLYLPSLDVKLTTWGKIKALFK